MPLISLASGRLIKFFTIITAERESSEGRAHRWEFTLSGNALKTLARSIACLSRIGNDLAIQASPSQLSFHALNSSRSAYQFITFKPNLFDVFTVSGAQVQCSILLKSSLQEITIIATECNSDPSDAASEYGGKAVEFQSYIDPTKDPAEEFVQYAHSGNPVDLTFAVKELKVGEPILMAPKFGIDEMASSNFAATLVVAIMLTSELQEDGHGFSQRHRSNWVGANEDEDDDNEDGDDSAINQHRHTMKIDSIMSPV
ncbi:hypothetical protein NL676_020132 [Syzygium grande]|nr:hypothetical protein NL676_020132 [Syzygium grande]